MSYVIAAPEMMTAAATDLASIGSTLSADHMTAALPTAAVIPAAADEVSASIAHLFSRYGGGFQALAGKASAFHEQFVHTLKASASAYTSAEVANAALLKPASNTFLSEFLSGLVSIFEQNPLEFLAGTVLFFLLIPVFILFLIFLPFLAVFAAA
jgi:PE family